MLGMCLDKRVLAGLAFVGAAVLVFTPNLVVAVLPLLLVAICPLSMLLMGKAMMGGSRATAHQQQGAALGVASPDPIDVPYQIRAALTLEEQVALRHLLQQRLAVSKAGLARSQGPVQECETSETSLTVAMDAGNTAQVRPMASATRA